MSQALKSGGGGTPFGVKCFLLAVVLALEAVHVGGLLDLCIMSSSFKIPCQAHHVAVPPDCLGFQLA